jgi:hypothetical protein
MGRRAFDGPDVLVVTNHAGMHTHDLDLRACRRALMRRQMQEAGYDRLDDVAQRSGASLTSVHRFWRAERPMTVTVARKIVESLGVTFADVATVAMDAA